MKRGLTSVLLLLSTLCSYAQVEEETVSAVIRINNSIYLEETESILEEIAIMMVGPVQISQEDQTTIHDVRIDRQIVVDGTVVNDSEVIDLRECRVLKASSLSETKMQRKYDMIGPGLEFRCRM